MSAPLPAHVLEAQAQARAIYGEEVGAWFDGYRDELEARARGEARPPKPSLYAWGYDEALADLERMAQAQGAGGSTIASRALEEAARALRAQLAEGAP